MRGQRRRDQRDQLRVVLAAGLDDVHRHVGGFGNRIVDRSVEIRVGDGELNLVNAGCSFGRTNWRRAMTEGSLSEADGLCTSRS